MRIKLGHNLSFERRLKQGEEAEYVSVLKEAKQKIGGSGHSVLIVPSSSLPHGINNNSGCGNILNKESQEFFNFAKLYWGINYVQLLPEGVWANHSGGYKPYSGSSLDLGNQIINLELLTTKEYGQLLDKNEIKNVVKANTNSDKDTRINIENTLSKESQTEKTLRKAFDELLKKDTPNKTILLNEIEKYKNENEIWLNRKAIYQALTLKNGHSYYPAWNEIEKNLFNADIVSQEQRNKIIKELEANPIYNKEKDFYIFKQFLADKHLKQAKEILNSKGIKLSGDMIVGCSFDETWMFPKAFYNDYSLPWGLNAINFENAEGKEFFRLKVNNFAKRYEGIRSDASWLYSKQILENKINHNKIYKEYRSEILDIIDDCFKKIKGSDFDLHNIMHEFEADTKDFSLYNENGLKPETAERLKIYKSDFLSENWDSADAFKKRGWKNGSYIIGPTNHDTISLKNLYADKTVSQNQIEVLSKILKIPKEKFQTCADFIQAKFAEPIRNTHNMFFFADALNLDGNYEKGRTAYDAYRLKIPANYQDDYFKSLEKGEGLNIMDAFEKAFAAEGLDKKEPELFKKIQKYNKILKQKESSLNTHNRGNSGKFIITITGALIALSTALVLVIKNKKQKTANN